MNALAVVHIVPVVLAACVLLAGFAIVLRAVYQRAEPGQALVIARLQGEPRVAFSGAVVMPILQRAERIDLKVQSLRIVRCGKEGVICRDDIRVDVAAAFHVRVGPTVEDILRVASAVGCARATHADTLDQLFTAKLAEALKAVARRHDFLELAADPGTYRDEVLATLGEDLSGYRLDDAVIERLEHTAIDALDPNNVLDARGMRKLERLLEEGAVPPPASTTAPVPPSAPAASAAPGASPDALLPGATELRTPMTLAELGGGERSLRLDPSPPRFELRAGARTLLTIDLALPLTSHLSLSPDASGSGGDALLLTLRQRQSGHRLELAVTAPLASYLEALPGGDAEAARAAARGLPQLRAEALAVGGADMVRLLAAVRFVQEAAGQTHWR